MYYERTITTYKLLVEYAFIEVHLSPQLQTYVFYMRWRGEDCFEIGYLHWEIYISISFQIEWDMIVVTVLLSILNQMEFHLVQNRKENYPIQFEMNWNTSFSHCTFLRERMQLSSSSRFIITCKVAEWTKFRCMVQLSFREIVDIYTQRNREIYGKIFFDSC